MTRSVSRTESVIQVSKRSLPDILRQPFLRGGGGAGRQSNAFRPRCSVEPIGAASCERVRPAPGSRRGGSVPLNGVRVALRFHAISSSSAEYGMGGAGRSHPEKTLRPSAAARLTSLPRRTDQVYCTRFLPGSRRRCLSLVDGACCPSLNHYSVWCGFYAVSRLYSSGIGLRGLGLLTVQGTAYGIVVVPAAVPDVAGRIETRLRMALSACPLEHNDGAFIVAVRGPFSRGVGSILPSNSPYLGRRCCVSRFAAASTSFRRVLDGAPLTIAGLSTSPPRPCR